jgi:hypothetical protein
LDVELVESGVELLAGELDPTLTRERTFQLVLKVESVPSDAPPLGALSAAQLLL